MLYEWLSLIAAYVVVVMVAWVYRDADSQSHRQNS